MTDNATPIEYKKNVDINKQEIKNKILKFLYSKKLNNEINFSGIEKINDMDNIKNGDYIVCPRFKGTRSWVIFFKTKDSEKEIPNYYAVNFPKHNERKKMELIIHTVDVRVSNDFYDGTIMEGIFYKVQNEIFLVIDEVYLLCGESQLLKSKSDRLNNLVGVLTDKTIQTMNYHIYVCQHYKITETYLSELFFLIKGNNVIQDIIFYPQLYGRKIYQYSIMERDIIDDVIKIGIYKLQNTKIPDVYNILSLDTDKKIDIAYLPDMTISKKCKQWFKDTKESELLVKFKMDLVRKKWIPIELIEEDVEIEDKPSKKSKSKSKSKKSAKDSIEI
jgi:hypothetical protein